MKRNISIDLIRGIESLHGIGKLESMHGDSIDKTIMMIISKNISSQLISTTDWKTNYKNMGTFCEGTGDYYTKFDFDPPCMINKPRGSQNTPDFMILYKNRGICFESKSTKAQHIVWNSGIPKPNIIYIFNGNPPKNAQYTSTTFFMGKDMVSKQEVELLKLCRKTMELSVESYNLQLKPLGLWNVYPRPMYGCSDAILTNTLRISRERSVVKYIHEFNWEFEERV